MPKSKEITFVCNECGEDFSKWFGKCPSCGAFNSLKEFREASLLSSEKDLEKLRGEDLLEKNKSKGQENPSGFVKRLKTGIPECDRVLGEGFFPGSLFLFGGHPGIGKSTLALQITSAIAGALYFSGEESREQILSRWERLASDKSWIRSESVMPTNSLEDIITTIEKHKPPLAVIDSVQMIGRAGNTLGSMTQIRENAEVLLKLAKSSRTVILLIGHVTKNEELAGPKVLEHLVDGVLYLEGDRQSDLRILRSPKNRFGSTLEVGVFQMTSTGLGGLEDPSLYFLHERLPGSHGSAVTVTREGNRNFLQEVQALTIKTNFGNPRRTAHGLDISKLHLLLAVVSKFTPFKVYEYDTYLNVLGGMKIEDPSADLAICGAVISSRLEKEISASTVLFGEVGLSGEVRRVGGVESRIREAEKMGFKKIICPPLKLKSPIKTSIEILEISSVRSLVKALWGESPLGEPKNLTNPL